MRLRIPAPERAGAIVMELDGVSKSYGETRVYAGNRSAHRARRPGGAGGAQRRRQVDAAADPGRCAAHRRGPADPGTPGRGRLLRTAPDRGADGEPDGSGGARERRDDGRSPSPARPSGRLSLLRRRRGEEGRRCSRAARRPASLSRRCCFDPPISWCSTSPPITWTWRPARSWKKRSGSTGARWS